MTTEPQKARIILSSQEGPETLHFEAEITMSQAGQIIAFIGHGQKLNTLSH